MKRLNLKARQAQIDDMIISGHRYNKIMEWIYELKESKLVGERQFKKLVEYLMESKAVF